ncbi:hypothetical protein WH265_13625 [Comamonas sp. MYb396]
MAMLGLRKKEGMERPLDLPPADRFHICKAGGRWLAQGGIPAVHRLQLRCYSHKSNAGFLWRPYAWLISGLPLACIAKQMAMAGLVTMLSNKRLRVAA